MSYQGTVPTLQTSVEYPSLGANNIEQSAIRTLVNGDLPSAEQVSSALMEARQSLNENKDEMKLSKKGELLEKDLDEVLGNAAKLIDEKNKKGVLDDLIHNAREVSREISTESAKLNATVNAVAFPTFFNATTKYRVFKDGIQALNISKDIVLFILGSGEFKQFLIDFLDFLQSFITYSGDELINLGQSVKKDISEKSVDSTLSELGDIKDSMLNKGKEWTGDTRKEYVDRLKSLMKRLGQRSEFNDLMNVFWQWMDQMKDRAEFIKERLVSKSEEVKDKAENSAQKIEKSEAFDKMWQDTKIIIDDLAGKGAFDSFYNSTWDLYNNLLEDVDAHDFFHNLKSFVQDALKDEKYMDLLEAQERSEKLVDQAKIMFTSTKYQGAFTEFFENGKKLAYKVANDSTTQEFSDSIKKFAQHFTLNRQGKPDIHVIQRSLLQLKNMVYPLLKQKIGTINVKNIVGTEGETDYFLQDVGISIPDFLPEVLELRTNTDTKMDMSNLRMDRQFCKVIMELNGLRPSFKNVSFAYKKNSFPKLEDNGVVNVDLSGGNGTKIQVIWKIETSNTPEKPFSISLIRVKAIIDKLDINILEAKHDIVDHIALALFGNSLKNKIAHALVDGIVAILKPMNDQLNEFFATRPLEHYYEEVNSKIEQKYGLYMDKLSANPNPLRSYEEKARDIVNSVESKLEALKETLSVQKEDLKENLNENLDLAKEIVQDSKALYNKATTKGEKKESVDNTEDNSADKTAELKQKAVDLKDAVLETAGKIKDKAVDGAVDLKEFAADKYPEVRDKAVDIKDQVVEKASDLKDKAVEKGNEAVEKANELKDKAVDKASELADKAVDKTSELADKASELGDKTADKASELADKAQNKASELKGKASEAVDKTADKASELKDKAADKVSSAVDKADVHASHKIDQASYSYLGDQPQNFSHDTSSHDVSNDASQEDRILDRSNDWKEEVKVAKKESQSQSQLQSYDRSRSGSDAKSSDVGKAAAPAFDQSGEDKNGTKTFADVAKDLKDVPNQTLTPGKVSWNSRWSEGAL